MVIEKTTLMTVMIEPTMVESISRTLCISAAVTQKKKPLGAHHHVGVDIDQGGGEKDCHDRHDRGHEPEAGAGGVPYLEHAGREAGAVDAVADSAHKRVFYRDKMTQDRDAAVAVGGDDTISRVIHAAPQRPALRTAVASICFSAMLAAVGLPGCGSSPKTQRETIRPALIESAEYDRTFRAALDVLRDMGFEPARQEYRFGRITTEPLPAPTIFEPWEDDQHHAGSAGAGHRRRRPATGGGGAQSGARAGRINFPLRVGRAGRAAASSGAHPAALRLRRAERLLRPRHGPARVGRAGRGGRVVADLRAGRAPRGEDTAGDPNADQRRGGLSSQDLVAQASRL